MRMTDLYNPSKEVLIGLLDLSEQARTCTDVNDFYQLLENLKNLFEYDFALCACGNLKAGSTIQDKIFDIVTSPNYPPEWLSRYGENDYFKVDPVAESFYMENRLFFWNEARERFTLNANHVVHNEASEFGLIDGYIHGTKESRSGKTTSIALSGSNIKESPRSEYILSYTVPHICEALKRVCRYMHAPQADLSQKQREVLYWLKEGKTDWEMSMILNLSQRAVRDRIHTIIKKLDASNARHAVAIAVEHNLIDL